MKGLTDFIYEQLETDTLQDKIDIWFLRNPEQALLWRKIVDAWMSTHQWDEASLSQFVKQKDVKDFLKFMQDDVNADINGIDITNTVKQIISNLPVNEALKISKDSQLKPNYVYHPKTKDELADLVNKLIKERGYDADLNDINTSAITDMSDLFNGSNFNGDISKWDVSNVRNMIRTFANSAFNRDISKWDVSNVEDMRRMFAYSKFNGDISQWDVSNVENMAFMFYDSKFNGDISKWDVSNVENMYGMFWHSKFNGDISKWDVRNVSNVIRHSDIFYDCPLEDHPEKQPKFTK